MLLNLVLSANLLLFNTTPTPVTLQDALNKKMVTVTVTSNPTGTHYHQPVIMHIKNITANPFQIKVENGRTFRPNDSTCQPIIVVHEMVADLSPGKTTDVKIPGMCFNATKRAPHDEMTYSIGKMATGNLAKVAQYLQDNKFDGYPAQHAIWCISNGEPLENIIDWDESKALKIAAFMADLTGQPMPSKPAPDDYVRNLQVRPNPKVTVGGNFEFTLLRDTEIRIGMFDANGIIVRELYYNPTEKPGNHVFDYEFDATVYTDDVYYIRYLENNVVWMEAVLSH